MTDNVYDPIGWRFCVAPMLDLTDRHCRYFHRLLSHRARLYTEMMTTGALVHGDVPHHLDFSEAEHRLLCSSEDPIRRIWPTVLSLLSNGDMTKLILTADVRANVCRKARSVLV